MSEKNNIQHYSAAAIEKYQKGLLSAKEMNAMEKAALDDPFLADAMEGYSSVDTTINADLQELQTRLNKRIEQPKVVPLIPNRSSSIPWLRIAAMVILVAGAAFLTYQIGFTPKENTTVAQRNELTDKQASETATVPQQETETNNTTTPVPIIEQPAKQLQVDKKNDNTRAIANSPVVQESVVAEGNSNNDIATGRLDTVLLKKMPGIQVEQDVPVTARASKPEERNITNTDNRVAGMLNRPVEKKSAEDAKTQRLFSQESNIFRGQVKDANNNALPFANITNTKDNIGTYSDANGNFVLTSPDSVLNVQVRSLGYNNSNAVLRNIPSGNNIVLQDDNHQLQEIVVSNRNANSSRARSNTMIMEEPEPVDGWENYDTYIANNVNTPDILKSKEKSRGQVELSFEVDKDGKPVNITVVKSLCDSCDQEAIRLVKEGPRFKQKAKRKGRTFVTISF